MIKNAIEDGYSACAGVCGTGWYGGVLVLEDRDRAFYHVEQDISYDQRAMHARRWSALAVNVPRRVALLQPSGDGMEMRTIAVAERIEGPVAPREHVKAPVLAWIERRAKQWHFMLFRDGAITTLLSRHDIIRCPAAAMTTRGPRFAFESDAGPFSTQVEVVDERGVTLYRAGGRAPRMSAAGEGFVLSTEQSSANAVHMRLEYFGREEDGPEVQELREGDYLFNASLAWSEAEQAIIMAAESSPCFGYGNQIGLHRTIRAWQWGLKLDAVSLGVLPVEQRAFQSIGAENMTPVKPFVLIDHGVPVVVFKQHRFTGFRAFGWDLFWCRREGSAWTAPVRISPATTTSDSDFGLVSAGANYVGLYPAHENEGGRGAKHSENHRVEIVEFDRDHRLDRVEVPEKKRAAYRIPVSYKNVAPEPPLLASPYEGRQLVWGDLHIHTIYSKCVSAVDGDPRENIRYAREVLGCRVFAIAEHTQHTTGPESVWLYDQLEATAGKDNVILYASEPGIRGTRHMNWYCRDRETFQKLERMFLSQGLDYPRTLRQAREDLPHDSVFVMRHVHGDPIRDEQIMQHVDPHFEVAMEAMQGRGNAMLGIVEDSPIFPNSFLDAGCKIGLVGGTDHYREWAPNHFCLTGFWVKEVSANGVWEAIRNRHTIAMSDSRVAMATVCKGNPMGGTVTLKGNEELRVSVQASCARNIRRVTLMRDGELLPWVDVNAKTIAVDLVDEAVTPARHWYVVTAEVETAYEDDHVGVCHASPYFVWKEES